MSNKQASAGVLAAVFLLLGSERAVAQGSIFTSVSDGATVNANIYTSRQDVYLNGGPQNPNAAGLPSGTYYFQVTDPSGATLLSSDCAECRQLTVANGVVSGATGPCPHLNGTFNAANGSTPVQLFPYDVTPNNGGEYRAWLVPTNAATVAGDCKGLSFASNAAHTDNFKVRESDGNGGPPPENVTITGIKFYDSNTNGVQDGLEPGIAGWRIEKEPPNPADVTYTALDGSYGFIVAVNSGLYTITEVPPPPGFFPAGNWINTTATSGQVNVLTTNVAGPTFGNVCLGPGGGRTLGFWSNRNGQATMNDGGSLEPELLILRGLNLRNANGTDFDPATYPQFRTWLLNADAVNMAYMLSAQLAAMALNVEAGFVSGSALIFAGTAPAGCTVTGLNAAGFISVANLANAADASLLADGFTPAGDEPNRSCQEFLKNTLDNANNNLTFVQPGPASCPFTSPY